MPQLVVAYGKPDDPAAFDSYYTSTHQPLADKIPGVTSWHAGHCAAPDGSEPPYYVVAVLNFASQEALSAGLASPDGQAAAADIANFATGGATMLVIDDLVG
ncbi:EthD family reductase [Flexivirga caeni]|uniref:EthD family reductase n=1 Tax=Flexivirga caeni TaxID=2294115 RepID=A0A3M9M7E1_9MICO|nr:EthD family reductase [Flexivirga caeni]RNI20468.1 EthD family reductase [Flexivirga caeni]